MIQSQSHRGNDAVITVCQNNQSRRIEIREINESAAAALGYGAGEVVGRSLTEFLPKRIDSLLNEYVEFEDDGNDVGGVLSKVQSFCIVDRQGKEVGFRLKVLRSESLDGNAYFRLILQSRVADKKDEAFRALLRENFKGHEVLEPHTSLPDRNSLAKDVDLVHYYVTKDALRASLALLQLDQHATLLERGGEDAAYAALKHIALIARQNLRTDDTIGCLDSRRLGLILLDTTSEAARMVLNRLRWAVAAHPFSLADGHPMPLTVSIAFLLIDGDASRKDTLQRAEQSIARLQTDGNALVEAA
ncbi:MAG: diguanylate cyclase [Alphaproteobacteria bacterium]|nr:diguanylate cyclase [Alphaproteobacteria bacterium]